MFMSYIIYLKFIHVKSRFVHLRISSAKGRNYMTVKEARKIAGWTQQRLRDEPRIPNKNQFFAESADKNI